MVTWELLGEVIVTWELLGEVTVTWELLGEVFPRLCCGENLLMAYVFVCVVCV
jgi:hypothetical protein